MKIRKGFVSNSSSSSFVCDVCGDSTSDWDMTYNEAEMVCCKNGHEFCEYHLLGEDTLDILRDEEREDYDEDWRYVVPSKFCPICQFETVMDSDIVKYLYKIVGKKPKELREEIKSRFESYDHFIGFIKE